MSTRHRLNQFQAFLQDWIDSATKRMLESDCIQDMHDAKIAANTAIGIKAEFEEYFHLVGLSTSMPKSTKVVWGDPDNPVCSFCGKNTGSLYNCQYCGNKPFKFEDKNE